MLITEHFTFMHLPKTGGTYIIKSIGNAQIPILEHQCHGSYHQIPPEYQDKPTIAVVRNPWHWYHSAYQFGLTGRIPEMVDIFSIASNQFTLNFEQTTVRLLDPDPSFCAQLRLHILQSQKDNKPGRIHALEPDCLYHIKEQDIGILTYLSQRIIPPNVAHLWRQETLRSQYFAYLQTLPLTRDQRMAIIRTADQKVSPKHPLTYVYTPNLSTLIEHKDRQFCQRYNYQIPPQLR